MLDIYLPHGLKWWAMAKFQLQDFVQYGQMFEAYRSLLSDDRQAIMADYFEFNATLAEIAEERKISRQAVLDAIEKSCEKLQGYENALHLVANRSRITKELKDIHKISSDALAKGHSTENALPALETTLEKISEKVENILKEI